MARSYSAVLLSRHDSELVEDLLRLGMSSGQSMHPVIRLQLLNSACELLRDRNARRLTGVPSALVEEVVKALQQVLFAETPTPLSPPSTASSAGPHDEFPQPQPLPPGQHATAGEAAAGSPAAPLPVGADEALLQHQQAQVGSRLSSSSGRPAFPGSGGDTDEEEEARYGSFVGFMRKSMGLRNSKDNGFIILLEALAHIVSMELSPAEDKLSRGGGPHLNALAKNLAGDAPLEHRQLNSMNAQLNEALRGRLAKDGAPLDEVLTKSFSVERPLKFEELGGFDMIAEAITSDMCEAVSAMSLWMLLELAWIALGEHDLSRYIVRVLDIARLSVRKRLMCLSMLRSWLQDLDTDDRGQQMRQQLRDSGCIASLVAILQSGGPAVAREALLTLATLVSASDKMKASLEARVGLERLGVLISQSALAQPKPAFDLVVVEALFQVGSLA